MKKNIQLLFYLIGCIIIIGCLYHFALTGIDDANIYFVYMKNFATGNGFVYNIGGEKVEGFTSILWTLIGSCIFKFTNKIEISLFLINCILIFSSLKIAINIIQLFKTINNTKNYYEVLFLGLLIVFPGFYDWTIFSLLETGLWTFELTLFTYLLIIPYFKNQFSFQKSTMTLTLLFPFFIITRPESILLAIIFISIRFLQLFLENKSYKFIFYQLLPLLLVFIISIFTLTAWRLYYFGYPLPNTFYVKMSDGFLNNILEGFIYLIKYIIRYNPLIILFFCLIIYWIWNTIKEKRLSNYSIILLTITIISTIGIGIPFYTGGDHFRMARFYQAFNPIFYLNLIMILHLLSTQHKFLNKFFSSNIYVVLLLIILSFTPIKNIYSLFINKKHSIAIEFDIAKEGRATGEQLNVFFNSSKKPSIAVITAGGIAYTYAGFVNDVLGLNNTEVAHNISDRPKNIIKGHRAFNKEIFLKQEPDLFLFEFVSDTINYIPIAKRDYFINGFGGKVIKHIYKDTTFLKMYANVYLINKQTSKVLCTYASKEFLEKLSSKEYEIRYLSAN